VTKARRLRADSRAAGAPASVGGHRGGMSSNRRLEEPYGFYHLGANAAADIELFRDDVDRLVFLNLLREQARLSGWTVLAYSLMTTHYHVLLRIREDLSSGLQRLQSVYARRYNRRHGRRGVVWMKRVWDERIQTEGHLRETIRYIARNAVRAGICDRPEEWPWCSYGSAIGTYPPDSVVDERELLALFGTDAARARKLLRTFVNESDPRLRAGRRDL
jgi:REP element-mobilizing transposase RayT